MTLATQREGGVHRTADPDIGFNRQRHQIQAMPHIAQEYPAMLGNMGSNCRPEENAGDILQVQSHGIGN